MTHLPEKKTIFCNRCKIETNYVLKGDHTRRFYEEERGQLLYWEEEVNRFWVCAGCDQGTLEICYTMDGMLDQNGDNIYDSTYYPKRKVQYIHPKRYKKIPDKLGILYTETVEAYNNKLFILCAAGLRALIEGICVDKKITGNNLARKIDSMTTILPQNIVTNLHSFRFMGNVALHELNPPKKTDLSLAIDVIEDLMNFIYELDYKTTLLNKIKKKEAI